MRSQPLVFSAEATDEEIYLAMLRLEVPAVAQVDPDEASSTPHPLTPQHHVQRNVQHDSQQRRVRG